MELMWSFLTLCLAMSKNFSTLCAIRFLVGLAESTFYPAMQVSPVPGNTPRYDMFKVNIEHSTLLVAGTRKRSWRRDLAYSRYLQCPHF